MAAVKQKTTGASHAPPPAAASPEAHGKKSKKKKRAATKPRRDDADAHALSDALDFGTLPAPDEGLAEAIAAVLEAPRAAANGGGGAGGGQHLGVAGADATAAAQAELLATANELYQRMDAGGGGLRPDGAYWAALPAHIRNFVRTASLSPPLRAAGGNERAKAQAMYAIAQQMVQTGEQGGEGQVPSQAVTGVASSERDVSSSAAVGQLVAGWQGDMSLPVDPSFFAEAAFTAALEQQGGEESGIIGVGVGVAEVTHGEGGDSEERSGFHSIVSAGEEGERLPTAAGKGPMADERSRRGRVRRRQGPVSVGGEVEEDREIPTRDGKLVTSSVVSDLLPKAEAAAVAAAAAASAAARAAQAARAKASQLAMPSQTRQPSSRAQGKQPMNYPPPHSGTTTTTTTSTTTTSTTAQQKTNTPSPTTRSSRAASKAPLPPHPYPHTHPHHHPSPPSSNTSQTQKHRPPSTQAPSSRNNTNSINKIWSTSSTEERERIKEFWLGLGEEDRRNLVKLEKEAVLKKMKEQQRHSCGCAVCGRKRSVCQFRLWIFFKSRADLLMPHPLRMPCCN
jgi:hypothetical protein